MRRDLLTEVHLRQRYEIDGLTAVQIASELHASKPTILRALRLFGIARRHNDGRRIGPCGYVYIRRPDHPYATAYGYVREHRLVMEKRLGRYLEPGEVVHHRNGQRADNCDENLELWKSNGAHHSQHHCPPQRMRAMQAKGSATKRARAMRRISKPRICGCGCGRSIALTLAHKPSHLPTYLQGHGKHALSEARFAQWLAEQGMLECICGCGGTIRLTRYHFRHQDQIPQFIHGHNSRRHWS